MIGDNKGESLLSVLVAIGIAGILGVIVMRTLGNQQTMMKKMQLDKEREELKPVFQQKIQCGGLECKQVTKKINALRVGRWHFQADCHDTDVYVSARKYSEDHKQPILDPVTRKPMEWKRLYPGNGGIACSLDGESLPDIEVTEKVKDNVNEKKLHEEIQKICPPGKKINVDPQTLEITCT